MCALCAVFHFASAVFNALYIVVTSMHYVIYIFYCAVFNTLHIIVSSMHHVVCFFLILPFLTKKRGFINGIIRLVKQDVREKIKMWVQKERVKQKSVISNIKSLTILRAE